MQKKRFIIEQDESEELSDFKKILAINKKRLSYGDVDFYNSEGKDFSDIIEITQDGSLFTFDGGLVEYLLFFFPDEFEEGSDSYYDAQMYDYMYAGNYDWYSEFSDRYYDDWGEGYILDALNDNQVDKLKEIVSIVSPTMVNYFYTSENGRKKIGRDSKEVQKIIDLLTTLGFESSFVGAYIEGSVSAVRESVAEYIKDIYCNCLKEAIGLENYSQRYCFWKYELSWGDIVLLYARFGSPEDNLYDLLFEAIKKSRIKHAPEHYEIQGYVWDNQRFSETFNPEMDNILDKKYDEILDDEEYSKDYIDVLNKVSLIGGTDSWIKSKNGKYQIRILKIDPKTLKIDYSVSDKSNNWSSKKGRTTIDELINLLNYESLFHPSEFREQLLRKFRNSIL